MLPSTEPAVELFAILCRMYELDPMGDGVVLSHKEGHARGIATNHGDPEHRWNGLHMGYTMDGFRKAVKNLMRKKEKEEEKEADGQGASRWGKLKSGTGWISMDYVLRV